MVDVVEVLSIVASIVASAIGLGYWIGRKFAEIDARFDRIESRLESEVGSLRSTVERIARGFSGYQEFFVELLVSEDVITKEKGDLARGEVKRIMDLALANPLTKEEWQKIKYYLEKDELTLEEALEFRDLARKVVEEHGDRYEAWKLHLYASMMVGFARKKLVDKERKEKEQREKEKKES